MKHELDETTRAIVRKQITAIASKFNLSRKDAESYFRRNLGTSDVSEKLLETVRDDIDEQKEDEKQLRQQQKENT